MAALIVWQRASMAPANPTGRLVARLVGPVLMHLPALPATTPPGYMSAGLALLSKERQTPLLGTYP